MNLGDLSNFVGIIPAVLRVSTPILLCALGVLLSDRAGTPNIGVEGIMLSGAFTGVMISAGTGSAGLGFLGALIVGAALGAVLSFAYHILRTDLFLSGIAINMAAAAGTSLLLFMLVGDRGISSSLKSAVLPTISLPLIKNIPVLGPVISGQNILVYGAIVAVAVVALFLMKTPAGIRLRAVGESPAAAAAAGLNVVKTQFWALVASGVFAASGGAYLSMGYVSWFSQNMSAGRGFMAIAAQVMGQGSALGTMIASYLLGTAGAVAIDLQGAGLPNELMQAIPYIVPVLALVFHSLRRKRSINLYI